MSNDREFARERQGGTPRQGTLAAAVLLAAMVVVYSGCVDSTLLDPLPFFETTPATLITTDCGSKGDETGLFICADVNQTLGDPVTLTYFIPGLGETEVTLLVYDTRGTIVRTLLRDTTSVHSAAIVWDLTDAGGAPVPRGDYRVYFKAGTFTAVEGDVQVF
jgi:hypothetical protein